MTARRIAVPFLAVVSVVACAPAAPGSSPGAPGAAMSAAPPPHSTAAPPVLAAPPAPTPSSPTRAASVAPSAPAIFARIRGDLADCYERGRKATPEMKDGKVTLHATMAAGRTACVIPADDRGLTQEVEDCMGARLAREAHEPGVEGAVSLPVIVNAGAVSLGAVDATISALDSIETTRMPDAFEAVEDLVPKFEACVARAPRSGGVAMLVAGARVAADGRVECAISMTSGGLPDAAARCARGVLEAARFPPPKRAPGLVLLPLRLSGR